MIMIILRLQKNNCFAKIFYMPKITYVLPFQWFRLIFWGRMNDKMRQFQQKNDTVKYVFNDNVVFTPSESTLEYNNPIQVVKLQRPASLCLQLLLECRYELVSQKALMVHGWGEEKEKTVTVNAFYQVMHHLRQSLSQVGCADLIYTVSRKGTGVNRSISISEIPAHITINVKSNFWRGFKSIYFLFLSLFLALIIVICFFIKKNNYFDGYSSSDVSTVQLNKCKIFYDNNGVGLESLKAILNLASIDCNSQSSVYYFSNKFDPRVSLIVCRYDRRNVNKCYSVLIMDGGV